MDIRLYFIVRAWYYPEMPEHTPLLAQAEVIGLTQSRNEYTSPLAQAEVIGIVLGGVRFVTVMANLPSFSKVLIFPQSRSEGRLNDRWKLRLVWE